MPNVVPYSWPIDVAKNTAKKLVAKNYNCLVLTSDELKIEADRVSEFDDEVSSISYNIQESANPFPDAVQRRYPLFLFEKPFIAQLQDGYIVGPNAAAVTSDGRIVADSLNPRSRHHDVFGNIAKAVFSPSYIKSQVLSGNIRTVPAALILQRDTSNRSYYHWLLEKIPLLRGVRNFQDNSESDLYLIVSKEMPGFVYEILGYLGFEKDKLISWDGAPLHAENLIVPSWPEPTPEMLDWLRKKCVENVDLNGSDFDNKFFYISRQRADRRKVVNYNEIRPILDEHDIQTIYFEDLTLKQELQLVNSGKGIIGPHGAGLTSMVWADDLSVLEIFNGTVIPPFYTIANILNFEYSAILGEPRGDKRTRDKDIYVDPNTFRRSLTEFIE